MNLSQLNFNLSTTTGEVNLSQITGQWVVLYFYPKDSTPGCTTQANEFSSLIDEFKALNTVLFGISRDSVKAHQNFTNKQHIAFNLISDPNEQLCQAFGVIKEKNMYGKMVMGIERSTFVFNSQGELIHEWRKVKAAGHAQEVLDWIRQQQ